MNEKIWKNYFEKIQLQTAIKSGITGGVALFLGVQLAHIMDRPNKLVSGLWTVMTALIVVQAYLGATYTAAWERFLGTLIGSIFGGIFTVLFGAHPISLGISIFLTVSVCSLFKLENSIKIATISVTAVMVLWGLDPTISPWTFAFFRFLDSLVGIIIAVTIAHILWPMKAAKKLRLTTVEIIQDLKKLFLYSTDTTKLNEEIDPIILKIIEMIQEAREYLETSQFEIRTSTSLDDWKDLLDDIEAIFEILINLQRVSKKNLLYFVNDNIKNHIFKLSKNIDESFDGISYALSNKSSIEISHQLLIELKELNEGVQNFREQNATRKLSLEDAEDFFVYFYNFKMLVQEILRLDIKIYYLYDKSQLR